MGQRPGSRWNSLERQLPVLIGGLVVVSVLATFAVVRLDMRQTAIDRAGERLARVTRELAELGASSGAQRREFVRGVVADPLLAAALRDEAVPSAEVIAVLERLRQRPDTAEPILLLDRSGRVVAGSTGPVPVASGAVPAPLDLPLTDTVAYSPLRVEGGSGVFWAVAPVAVDGGTLGYVAQRRTVGSPALRDQLGGLIGANINIAFANADGSVRVRLDGTAFRDTVVVTALNEVFERAGPRGDAFLAYAAPLRSTGWVVLGETPVAGVVALATEVKRRLLAVGLLLLALGGLAAWLVSRRVTRPLRRLAEAADAIAAGDYSRRTGVASSDEIGHLARSFDAMAGYVDRTHAELEHRFNEARRLAGELEGTNARLQQVVAELELAQHAAQEASAAKSEFLATMSHEIRTPINAMVGYTDLLEMGVPGPLTERQLEFVSRIRLSGDHLISIVNDVLDFAKIESGQMRVGAEVIAVQDVVREALEMMQARADERGVALRPDCARGLELVGDRHRVHQIMLNLVSNALKFTPSGGSVTVSGERRSSRSCPPVPGEAETAWACIIVADTGVGIAPEQRELIFEPFVQGTMGYTRPHGGTGLGLAISRSLARMMGGDLTVESEPGRGASFTVWLPAHVPARSHQPA